MVYADGSTQYFLCKLIPPRPTFHVDMNDEERAVMKAQ
jgi:hypothetical protein